MQVRSPRDSVYEETPLGAAAAALAEYRVKPSAWGKAQAEASSLAKKQFAAINDLCFRLSREMDRRMDAACRHVLALGYRPDECCIQTFTGSVPIDGHAIIERRKLRVNGAGCYEVQQTRSADGQVHTESITWGWPPYRTGTEGDAARAATAELLAKIGGYGGDLPPNESPEQAFGRFAEQVGRMPAESLQIATPLRDSWIWCGGCEVSKRTCSVVTCTGHPMANPQTTGCSPTAIAIATPAGPVTVTVTADQPAPRSISYTQPVVNGKADLGPLAKLDPLDVQVDGWTLRQLLDHDHKRRHED